MIVDSTALLNRRHVHTNKLDGDLLLPFPEVSEISQLEGGHSPL